MTDPSGKNVGIDIHDRHTDDAGQERLVSFAEVISFIGEYWISIVVITLLSAIASLGMAYSLAPRYKATGIFMPAKPANGMAKVSGQLGGLAALAGVNLSSQSGDDKTLQAIEVMKTWDFQERFIRNMRIEVPVLAANGWNETTGELMIDDRVYDAKNNKWLKYLGGFYSDSTIPNGWWLSKRFSDFLTVSQDKKTGLISISIEYYSPILAKTWVDAFAQEVNHYFQERDRIEARKNVEYLEKKMSATGVLEMRAMFAELIEDQTKTLMLADLSDEYVFKTLGPSKIPQQKSRPARALICVAGTVLGFIGSIGICVVRRLFRRV